MTRMLFAAAVVAATAAGAWAEMSRLEVVSPVDKAELRYSDPRRAVVTFQWKQVPDAARYRVLLDLSPRFAKPLHEKEMSATSFQLTGLDVGHYHWRLVALSDSGAEMGTTEPLTFRVSRGSEAAAPAGD